MQKLTNYLFRPVSPVASGLFRVVYGVLMFFQFYYIEPYIVQNLTLSKYLLKYDFFTWVKITSPENLELLFLVAMLFSVLYTVGFLYRIASTVMFLCWTYIFLLDVGHYNNHYYLNCILLFFSIFVNGDAFLSVKSYFKGVRMIPNWNVSFFKLQMFVVYFYGAIAKLNIDWLKGLPLQYWLGEDFSLLGIIPPDYSFVFMAWFGLFFDFFVGFMLFHNKLKYYSLLFIVPFHLTNHFIWSIGTFPWMAIGICVFYFNDELTALFSKKKNQFTGLKKSPKLVKYVSSSLLVFYAVVQVLMPLRQYLIPGETSWHGYGNYFAWRMMLADKQGAAKVVLYTEDNQKLGDVRIQDYMNVLQFARMIHIPMHFVRFAHFLDQEIKKYPQNQSLGDVKVKVSAFKTLNNRPFAPLIDSTVDLSNVQYQVLKKGNFIIPYVNTKNKMELDVIYEDEYLQFK